MKILVVDDEKIQLNTLVGYLKELKPNAQVKAFQRATQALEELETWGADLALLDIKMAGMTGIQLAVKIKALQSNIKIIFCTGYSQFALDAFRVHANGYLCKPIVKEELRSEIEYLFENTEKDRMKELVSHIDEKPYLHTFGNFDLFVNGAPITFKRSKSKEALAYLVDRKGTWVTNQELVVAIWEFYNFDTPIAKYASVLVKDLVTDLKKNGVEQIVERQWGKIRLKLDEVDCDYLSMMEGDMDALNSFRGEYMSQYSWGEVTLSNLLGKC